MAKTKIEVDLVIKGGESVEQVENKTKSLKTQLKEMKTLLASGTLDNEAFKKLSQEAGQLQDHIADVNQQVNNLASDSRRLDGLIGITQGIVGGFAAVQGITALVGDENEDLQKTMVKLQGAMSALAGVQEIQNALQKESTFMMGIADLKAKALSVSTRLYAFATGGATTATNALRIALIGLTTAGIGIAIVVLMKYVEALNRQKEVEKERLKSLNEYNDELIKNSVDTKIQTNSIIQLQTILNDNNKTLAEKKTVYKELQTLIPSLTEYTYEQAKAEGVLNEAITNEIALIGLRAKATALENYVVKEEEKKLAQEQISNAIKQVNDLSKINKLKSEGNYVTELSTKNIAKSLTPLEQLAKVNQDIIDLQTKQNIIKEKGEKISVDKPKINKETDAERDARVKKLIAEQEARDKEQAILLEEDKVDRFAQIRAVDTENIIKDSQSKLFALGEYNREVLNAEQTLVDAKRNALETGFNIANQFTGKNKALADTLFAIQKGVAIAQIVIDTQKEIAGYYSNPTWKLLPDGGLSLASAASAGAKIRAATSIASIGATTVGKFMGGGSGSVGGSTGGGGSVSSQPPRMDKFESNRPPMNPNQRVYVLEKDITDSQGRVAKIRHNATLI
jgi:hypothetical protein